MVGLHGEVDEMESEWTRRKEKKRKGKSKEKGDDVGKVFFGWNFVKFWVKKYDTTYTKWEFFFKKSLYFCMWFLTCCQFFKNLINYFYLKSSL